ncbi:hypothetical protein Q669_00695 [Labrenzia sp. C1B10]|nr:hypothetical protein Q669_00695 [Labrenzia sp. C1B10]ERS00924.1 hypothetical protein Q675_08950 [Labrenzia sp. C1B70]
MAQVRNPGTGQQQAASAPSSAEKPLPEVSLQRLFVQMLLSAEEAERLRRFLKSEAARRRPPAERWLAKTPPAEVFAARSGDCRQSGPEPC